MNGRRLKESGMQLALLNAGPAWLESTMQRFKAFCQARIAAGQPEFKLEDFRESLILEGAALPHSPNVYGALPRAACKQGLIEFTERYENARSPKTRCHPVKIWRAK